MPKPNTRRVLVVSPHFAPINAPDMHRARLMLPYIRDHGWEPTVLAVRPGDIEGGVVEPQLLDTYPADIRVVRVGGIPPRATRWAGLGSLWLRCGRALRAAGERLIREEAFDLVFLTTTQFEAFNLGPLWREEHGIPYVLDYQDPWVNSYYASTGTPPPGGRLKFAYSQWRARRCEPRVLRGASGIIAVSGAYGATMARNYPGFDAGRVKLLPFGATEMDLRVAARFKPAEPLVPRRDGNFHIVYTGRCGPDMSTSLSIVFRAFRKFMAERPSEAARVRFHFIGTDYAPRPFGREWAMPVAVAEGVEAHVSEHCYRVPYFEALSYLVNADALLAAGSNDPTYSASKLYPYLLARRPLLIVFNERSPVTSIAASLKCRMNFPFAGAGDVESLSGEVCRRWFMDGGMNTVSELDPAGFRPYTAAGMTESLAGIFDAALAAGRART
jgi:hypothetical protein